jgi:Nuclease-related domain
MLRDIHRQQFASNERVQSGHQRHLDDLVRQRDEALTRRRWWRWLRLAFAVWRDRRDSPRLPGGTAAGGDRGAALAAGMNGERTAAVEFGQALDDDWVMLRGYVNRRGEIDQVLLGPRGLFAIEVKHWNATVHCDGDVWRYDKYDRYGNLVKQDTMADAKGRSPSRQVNEPANELQKFLASRDQRIKIERVVLFTHPKSVIGSRRNMTVHVSDSTGDILKLVRGTSPFLDGAKVSRIENLIAKDHRYHESRRRPRAT